MKTCCRPLRVALRIVSIILLALVATEIALRLVLGVAISNHVSAVPTPVVGRPLVYADSLYWSTEFMQESDRFGAAFRFHDDGLIVPDDFQGVYFNSRSGRRMTTDQPANARHTIWVFGASTIFSPNVPDWYTIPSYLQRIVGARYRVENMAVQGLTAAGEARLIKQTGIQSGDIVIMYDGPNDALSPYAVEVKRRAATTPSWCHTFSWSVLVQIICIMPTMNVTLSPEDIANAYAQYERTVVVAQNYTARLGVYFVHVLQPTRYTIPEDAIKDGVQNTYNSAWPMFQKTPYTVDLTHTLDKLRETGATIYSDNIHVNERANAVIAQAIYDALFPVF